MSKTSTEGAATSPQLLREENNVFRVALEALANLRGDPIHPPDGHWALLNVRSIAQGALDAVKRLRGDLPRHASAVSSRPPENTP